MRKIVFAAIALVAFGVLLVPNIGVAHGTCDAFAGSINAGPGIVTSGGNWNCHGTNHTMLLTMSLQRRPGAGGTWSTYDSETGQVFNNTDFITGGVSDNAYNCAKDYRSKALGSATSSGSPPHSDEDFGPIFQNTC